MRRMCRWGLWSLMLMAAAGPARPAFAGGNTSNATAMHLLPDGTALGDYIYGPGGAPTERWYVTTLHGGRSYVIQAVTTTSSPTAANIGEARINAFGQDGASGAPGTFNLINSHAPKSFTSNAAPSPLVDLTGSDRAAYTPAAAANAEERIFIQVTQSGLVAAVDFIQFRVSVQETTLYCPWYFTDSNYEAFAQVMNVSSQAVSGTLTFYAMGSSTPVGSPVSFTLPAFGGTFFSAKGGAGAPAGSAGAAKITITNGPPGAIKANMTTVNATGIGLTHSFNVPFSSQSLGAQTLGANNP